MFRIFLVCVWMVASVSLVAAQQPYKLGLGDRLMLTVVGEPEISGEFAIDEAGEIVVPLLGGVKVAGLLLTECRDKIAASLADGYVVSPNVFVRITQVRPIHILGEVRNPGSFPFQHGSVIKTAIAQAGGYLRAESATRAMSEFLTADERMKTLDLLRDRLTIKNARLEAQLQRAANFTPPDNLNMPAVALERILSEEQRMLTVSTETLQQQLELLATQRAQLATQVADTEKQIVYEKKQLALIQQRVDMYEKLTTRGLSRDSVSLELQLALAAKEGDISRLEVERSRTQLSTIDLLVKEQDLQAAFKQLILTQLDDVHQKLAELQISQTSARELRASLIMSAGLGSGESESNSYALTVTRDEGAGAKTIAAGPDTRLEPGDLVEVIRLRPQNVNGFGSVGDAAGAVRSQ